MDGLGDIRAIEGTRVTIHARANAPIKEAAIDFEADGRRDIRMTVDGSEALASFVLGLRDDHQTPKYKSYAVRFTGTDDATNRDPVKYPIDVLPDQSPEASILAPAEKVREVRLDETVAIAVEARDPDFALSEVRLKGDVGGRTVLDEPLLSKAHTGRFTGRLQFTPIDHGLKAGDVMQYWVVARDNRTPQPNEAASERQTLRIGSPDPNQPRARSTGAARKPSAAAGRPGARAEHSQATVKAKNNSNRAMEVKRRAAANKAADSRLRVRRVVSHKTDSSRATSRKAINRRVTSRKRVSRRMGRRAASSKAAANRSRRSKTSKANKARARIRSSNSRAVRRAAADTTNRRSSRASHRPAAANRAIRIRSRANRAQIKTRAENKVVRKVANSTATAGTASRVRPMTRRIRTAVPAAKAAMKM